ncbi:FtsQ-type POTRA domain-containing protein, partial [Mycobacterium tuberculosis]|nr:FtsQ-type POTRA domain-containing protein [Mycobacterium tuberculosis]
LAAWAAYGAYVGGQYRGYLDDLGAMLGFQLTDVEIRGLASADSGPITERIGYARHRSLLTVNAESLRERIETLPWICNQY